VPERQIAVGNAFEIHPGVKNGLLYEIAQAQLTRDLFPDCPVKYMPPTKHMDGNLFRTHANDTLFNFVSLLTGQSIQTLGVPTEGIFTPHIHDRVLGLECARYVQQFCADLGDEISFRDGGIIQSRASEVLRDAHAILERIANEGLFESIGKRTFGNVSRQLRGGKGYEGVVPMAAGYCNPFLDLMRQAA
jgi:beta-lysine 5,6-aminomutase alpha subunit